VNIDPTFKPQCSTCLHKSTMVVVENSYESSKRAKPLGLEFDQEQKVDSNKEFGEEDMKDKIADTFDDNLEEEKIGRHVLLPKTLLLVPKCLL